MLGTAALATRTWSRRWSTTHGDRIVVAADARGGKVARRGLDASGPTPRPRELAAAMAGRGVRRFVYTPIEVDGTLDGPGARGAARGAAAADRAAPS